MSEMYVSLTNEAVTARSSIWLTCPDCDHTTRTLALMASRVLGERRRCPQCLSTQVPHMSQTPAGAHICASDAPHGSPDEVQEAYLRAWIERKGNKHQHEHWSGMLFRSLAARFSRTRPVHAPAQTAPAI